MSLPGIARALWPPPRLLSERGLTRKATLNSLASVLDYGARSLVGFVVTPFLVKGLGDELYGVWTVLGKATGYLTATSGRPTQALKWVVANRQSSRDFQEKRAAVGGAIAVWALTVPIQVSLGAALVWLAPGALHVSGPAATAVRVAAALLVARLLVSSLANVPRAVLEGENLGYKRMGLSALLTVIGGGLTLLALFLDTGIVGVAGASVATLLLTGLLYLAVVRTHVPWFGVVRPTRAMTRRFFALSGWFVAWRAIMQLMVASDVVVLGLLASNELVTFYDLTKRLPEVLIEVVGVIAFGVAPGLGGIIGGGDRRKAAAVRAELMAMTWLLVTGIGSTILVWNDDFVGLWVGAERHAGFPVTALVLVMVAQLVLIRNDSNVIDLTLDLRRKVLLGLLSAVLSVGLAAALVHSGAGVVGLCAGFIAGRSVLTVGYPVIVGRKLEVPWRAQARAAVRPALTSLVLFSTLAAVQGRVAARSWAALLPAAVLTLVATTVLAFYAGLGAEHRGRLVRRVEGVLRRVHEPPSADEEPA